MRQSFQGKHFKNHATYCETLNDPQFLFVKTAEYHAVLSLDFL